MAGLRRTWDKDRYEQLAKEKNDRGDDEDTPLSSSSGNAARHSTKEEFSAAGRSEAGPMGSSRAFIKARQSTIDLEGKVGKTELIAPTDAVQARGAGFWCEVCSCLLKDSSSYLDHINGRKHQKTLGFSMRTERADVSKVKDRLTNIKRKIDDSITRKATSAVEEYESKVAAQVADEEIRKRRKKQDEIAKKKEREAAELETMDPEIAAMMGFGKFG